MKTGLVLGKFAPLHKGHQHMIETAVAEMDHVIVLIYDVPDVTPVPLTIRAEWIRELYPQVEVVESWDGPLEVSNDPNITAQHDAYLQKTFADREITHFYSSEFYGAHVSAALGACDRQVDPDRGNVPISSTALRDSPFAHRSYLHRRVYWDLITKVVFLGAPSTGKTTLAQQIAQEFDTAWVAEYGREYWDEHQIERRLTPAQLLEIAVGHRQREEQGAADANKYLFIDTEAITTLQFAHYYHGAARPELQQLAAESLTRYDVFFLCETDIPYEASWDRSGAVHREIFQRRLQSELLRYRIPFVPVSGPLEKRIALVSDVLSRFDRYRRTNHGSADGH